MSPVIFDDDISHSIAGDFGGVGGGGRRRLGQYFGLGVSSPWNNDILALTANLGGNSVVLGIYDTRYGITLNTTNVASWADARGSSGFGPTLSATGTQQPAFASNVITFNGTTNALFCTASSLYNVSQTLSIWMVGTCVTAGTSNDGYMSINDNSSFTNGIAIDSPIVTDIVGGAEHGGTYVAATSTIAPSTTRHTFLCSYTATQVQIEVPPNSAVTASVTALPSSANGILILGASSVSSTIEFFTSCTFVACGVLLGAYTAAQRASIYSWAQSVWASN